MSEEAYPEAAAILQGAGWTPHPEWGVYTRATLVMGGFAGSFHVKDYTRIPPGHPQYGPDTPDTAEEAAAWLVERFKPAPVEENQLSLESLEFRIEDEIAGLLKTHLAPEPEADETPQHESDRETGEASGEEMAASAAPLGEAPGGFDADDAGARASAEAMGDGAGLAETWRSSATEDGAGSEGASGLSEPLDADFDVADLGQQEELEEELADLPALEGAEFEPTKPEEPEEEAPQGQDRFIGLDDLDRVKRLRIGDVATEAALRVAAIEEAAGEHEGEYLIVQGFVVTNLDKHTGAFTLQDPTSLATYHRFVELDAARSRIAIVEKHRKEATAWLLDPERTREDVIAFDVQAAFA